MKKIKLNKKQKYYFGYAIDNFCKDKDKKWCKTNEAKKEKKEYKKLEKKCKKQKERRGFDDTEIWNLDNTIAFFILPRLKRFRKKTHSYPTNFKSLKKWKKTLKKIIIAFELLLKKETYELNEKETKQVKKGLNLFSKFFTHLWI